MSAFSSIPVRSNGPPNIDASWFNSLRTAGLASLGAVKYTVSYSDLSAAATTNDIELYSLAAMEIPIFHEIKHSTAFSGGSVSALTLSVGISGDLAKYLAAFDVFQAIGDTVNAGQFTLLPAPNHGSATSIRVAATAIGDDLDQLTQGSVDIWAVKFTLPS